VKPDEVSSTAKKKKAEKQAPEGLPVHSFLTLMAAPGAWCLNRIKISASSPIIVRLIERTPLQAKAF
jgi:hypothetical protein